VTTVIMAVDHNDGLRPIVTQRRNVLRLVELYNAISPF